MTQQGTTNETLASNRTNRIITNPFPKDENSASEDIPPSRDSGAWYRAVCDEAGPSLENQGDC